MALRSSYPVLTTEDVVAIARFYAEHMGFAATFKSDWYVSLRHRENPAYELAVLSPTHETIPGVFRGLRASGLLLNFEVSDAAAEYERLKKAGLRIVLPPRDEGFGQRHFIREGPGDVMLDVIEEIEPSPSSPSNTSRRGALRLQEFLKVKSANENVDPVTRGWQEADRGACRVPLRPASGSPSGGG